MEFTQSFEITKRKQAAYDEGGTIELGKATVSKTFAGVAGEGDPASGASRSARSGPPA